MMKLTKVVCVLTSAVMLFSAASCGNSIDEMIKKGDEIINERVFDVNPAPADAPANACGDNLTWRIERGTLHIEGSGDMWDFVTWNAERGGYDIGTPPWFGESYLLMVLSTDLTSIGDWAFTNSHLMYINIPDSVKTVGEGAFLGTSGVTRLTIGSGVETIKGGAFYGTGAETLVMKCIPEYIADDAFGECPEMTHAEFYGTVEEWDALVAGTKAFDDVAFITPDENGNNFKLAFIQN